MQASLVVHAHFYQPLRDDPVNGQIPPEFGAEPFSNWNQRIAAECYRPNAELGNFEHVSFDLGPTLASWLERNLPKVHRSICEAERKRYRERGFGGGLAQAYHHTILPLASRREKELQVAWGIADFEHRFGHRPRGLWLPETAVDTETLEVLAEQGIEFTVLAPWQAARFEHHPFEPRWAELPSGRRIALFFYHGPLSGRLSFDPGLSINADAFTRHFLQPLGWQAARRRHSRPLILVATDGELYGHHQKHREHFLAYLLRHAAPQAGFAVTTLERYLDEHPPGHTVSLREPSSWSCWHGVARWQSDCPCTAESGWKSGFRDLLSRLAARLDELYQEHSQRWLGDGDRLLERSVELSRPGKKLGALVTEIADRRLAPARLGRLRKLLEAQWLRHRMFTSCAWFH
nr:DUF3536 domain-containing protein [Thermoanaerobaculia bacterium]